MKEEKYIEQLLDVARNEPAKISFEEVVARFESSQEEIPLKPDGNWFDFLFHLNGLIAILLSSMAVWGVLALTGDGQIMDEKETTKFITASKTKTAKSIPEPRDPIVDSSVIQAVDLDRSIPPAENQPGNPVVADFSIADTPTEQEQMIVETAEPDSIGIDAARPEPLNLPQLISSKESLTPVSGTDSDFTRLPAGARLRLIDATEEVSVETPASEIRQSVGLVLLPSDQQETVLGFVATLESYGLEMSFSSTSLEKRGNLNQFVMKFKHPKGMDFKLKSTGFSRFEIHLQLDANRTLQGFKYRFNNEDYTDVVPLICKGHKRHIYGNGHRVIGGTTNVPIGY